MRHDHTADTEDTAPAPVPPPTGRLALVVCGSVVLARLLLAPVMVLAGEMLKMVAPEQVLADSDVEVTQLGVLLALALTMMVPLLVSTLVINRALARYAMPGHEAVLAINFLGALLGALVSAAAMLVVVVPAAALGGGVAVWATTTFLLIRREARPRSLHQKVVFRVPAPEAGVMDARGAVVPGAGGVGVAEAVGRACALVLEVGQAWRALGVEVADPAVVHPNVGRVYELSSEVLGVERALAAYPEHPDAVRALDTVRALGGPLGVLAHAPDLHAQRRAYGELSVVCERIISDAPLRQWLSAHARRTP